MAHKAFGLALHVVVSFASGFTSSAFGQEGLERLVARQQSGPPPMVQIGLTLTIVSMLILLLVALAMSAQKQKDAGEPTRPAAPDPNSTKAPEQASVVTPGAPLTMPSETDQEDGDIATVKCPRCGKVVVDFKEMRQDALSCPGCGDELRPAP